MTSIERSSQGEIFVAVSDKLLGVRDTIAEKVKNQAKLKMNITWSSSDVTAKAYELISEEYREFGEEAARLFQSPPLSEFAIIILTASKSKYFFSSSLLLGEVMDLLAGKSHPLKEANSGLEWDESILINSLRELSDNFRFKSYH